MRIAIRHQPLPRFDWIMQRWGIISYLRRLTLHNKKRLIFLKKTFHTLSRKSPYSKEFGHKRDTIICNDLIALYDEFAYYLCHGYYVSFSSGNIPYGLNSNDLEDLSKMDPCIAHDEPVSWQEWIETPFGDDYALCEVYQPVFSSYQKYLAEALLELRTKVHQETVDALYDTFADSYGLFQFLWFAHIGTPFIVFDFTKEASSEYPYQYWRETLSWIQRGMPLREIRHPASPQKTGL